MDVNSNKRQAFQVSAIKVKPWDKLGEKSLNCNGKTGEENRELDGLLDKKHLNLKRKTGEENHIV